MPRTEKAIIFRTWSHAPSYSWSSIFCTLLSSTKRSRPAEKSFRAVTTTPQKNTTTTTTTNHAPTPQTRKTKATHAACLPPGKKKAPRPAPPGWVRRPGRPSNDRAKHAETKAVMSAQVNVRRIGGTFCQNRQCRDEPIPPPPSAQNKRVSRKWRTRHLLPPRLKKKLVYFRFSFQHPKKPQRSSSFSVSLSPRGEARVRSPP